MRSFEGSERMSVCNKNKEWNWFVSHVVPAWWSHFPLAWQPLLPMPRALIFSDASRFWGHCHTWPRSFGWVSYLFKHALHWLWKGFLVPDMIDVRQERWLIGWRLWWRRWGGEAGALNDRGRVAVSVLDLDKHLFFFSIVSLMIITVVIALFWAWFPVSSANWPGRSLRNRKRSCQDPSHLI